MENVYGQESKFYVVQEKTENGEQVVRPIFYNSMERTYTPTSNYEYATAYTQEAAEQRRDRLQLLSELDEDLQANIQYHVIKRTYTNELVPKLTE